jgi:hypothetical protein
MYAFRGSDRRKIQRAAKTIAAIIARDVRAQNPKKTSALSTRTLILDTNNSSGLLWHANQLLSHLNTLAGEVV